MTEIAYLAVGIGGGVAVKVIYDWVRPKKNGDSKMANDIKWLKSVHDKCDSDGMPLWYVPRGMTKTLESVKDVTVEQNVTLKEIATVLKGNGDKLQTIINNGKGK